MLKIRPISIHAANVFVEQHHRHHGLKTGCRFAIAVYDGEQLHGVAICSNPVARNADDGFTLEVARLCTDGTYNACSMLYGACARIAKDNRPVVLDAAARAAEGGMIMPEWISVEDRLPEEQDEYLVLWRPKASRDSKRLFYEILEYEGNGNWVDDIQQAAPFGGFEVLYWMELPELPEEAKDG